MRTADHHFDFTAYFRQPLSAAMRQEIATWARQHGLPVRFHSGGGILLSMEASISFGVISEAHVNDFKSRFHPDEEVDIPMLGD